MPRSFESLAWMICTLVLLTFTTALPTFANILISVDKSTQQMSVSVDGVPRYRFAVSTGRAGYGTPNGTYHPQRLAASGFQSCITTHQCLIRSSSMAVMPSTAATRYTGLADLPHMAASVCTLQMPVLFSIW